MVPSRVRPSTLRQPSRRPLRSGASYEEAKAIEKVRVLLEYGARVNYRSTSYQSWGSVPTETALHAATERGFADAIGFLLERRARTDMKDLGGRTPLDLAVAAGREDIIKLLKQ